MRDEMGTGLSYVRNHGSLVSPSCRGDDDVLGFAVLTFLPLFTKNVQQRPNLQPLLAFSGAGSVVGALIVAGWKFRMGLTAPIVQLLSAALLAAFALSHTLLLSYAVLFVAGACLIVLLSPITSLVQMNVTEALRGRVMSIFMLAFRGCMPLGSLVSGYLATFIGAPMVIGINGVLLVVVALYFLARSHGVREA
jgi:MFS family permease